MVIDEIREVRHRISARFDNDPARLVAYYVQPARRCQNRQRGDDSSSRGSTARVTRPLSGPSPDPLNNSLNGRRCIAFEPVVHEEKRVFSLVHRALCDESHTFPRALVWFLDSIIGLKGLDGFVVGPAFP
jgi:hypothetical protein